MIKELLGSLGSWSLKLRDGAPSEVVDALDYFGHVAVVRGPVDVQALGDAILPAARYVGILRERGTDEGPLLGGVGMAAWLGDEDEKGHVIEPPGVTLTNASLTQCLSAILPPSVQIGYVGTVSGTYTGKHVFETPRAALNTIAAAFGVEWYVRGDGKLFIGTQAQLFRTTPNAIVVRRGAGTDIDLTALGGKFGVETDVVDYSTRILLVGQNEDDGTLVTGAGDAPSVPYFDMFGNRVKRTRMISESGTTVGSVDARVQLNLNRFNRTRKALKVSTEKYDIEGNFAVGDFAYVYDPETGVFDAANEVVFRGEVLHPDVIRVSGISYPVSEGHTVAFRRGNGTWLDLTPWVEFETGTNEITVGDLPKSLTGGFSNPVQQRAGDAANPADTVPPAAPTGVNVGTSVTTNDRGGITGAASVSWTAPGANADGTALTDFAHYIVVWKPSTATIWSGTYTNATSVSVSVIPGRNYDFRVAAVDVNGNVSAYSPTVQTLTAADNVAPLPPSDPQVFSYLGQLQSYWDGKAADGSAMPPDFNRVDVHVGTTSSFIPGPTNIVSSLVAAGQAFSTAPYGATRYVKFVAYDNSGNSSTSGAASGATTQVSNNDIASMSVGKLTAGTISAEVINAGRFTTALTGARTEFNASGFYRFDAQNNRMFAADSSGILVVGTYRTALTGRRIEMGSAGRSGRITFYAENGQEGYLASFTASHGDVGVEAVQLGTELSPVPASPVYTVWNSVQVASDEEIWSYSRLNAVVVGGDGPGNKAFHVYWAATRGAPTQQPVLNSRFSILPNETTMYGQTIGARIQWSLLSGNWIHTNDDGSRHELLGDGSVYFAAPNASTYFRMTTSNGQLIYRPDAAGGFLSIVPNPAGTARSPLLRMRTGENFEAGFQSIYDTRGLFFEFVNSASTALIGVRARVFEVNSDENSKTDIAVETGSFVERVRSAHVKRYKRKPSDKDDITPDSEIGLIAQEAPSEIVTGDTETGMSVDLYQMSAMLWGAVRELSDEIESMKKGKK